MDATSLMRQCMEADPVGLAIQPRATAVIRSLTRPLQPITFRLARDERLGSLLLTTAWALSSRRCATRLGYSTLHPGQGRRPQSSSPDAYPRSQERSPRRPLAAWSCWQRL
eukprot:502610-Hanusia_phi.AAC.1